MVDTRVRIFPDDISVDLGEEIMYGYAEEYVCVPRVYATITFYLDFTSTLWHLANHVRWDEGVDFDENDDYDYNFYVTVYDDYGNCKLESNILFVVYNTTADDDEQEYLIDLNDKECEVVLEKLESEVFHYYGKTLDEMMAEAREELRND